MPSPRISNRRAVLPAICILFLLAPQAVGQASGPGVDANALCSFITGKMLTALPQAPTLCAPVTDTAGGPHALLRTLVVSVFSPSDVLQGKMRRAWSTAFFQAAQGLFFGRALGGACESEQSSATCELRVSDSSLSQAGLYYKVSWWAPGWGKSLGLDGDPASEDYYERWWQVLEAGETTRRADRGSKDNAEQIAQDACKEFQNAFPASLAPTLGPPPACAAMLATNASVYVVLDFSNPLYAMAVNNADPLLESFGKWFDRTGYDGAVIFRTTWGASGNRLYRTWPLRDIEFWWEEAHSGVRDGADAAVRLTMAVEDGVEDRHSFTSKSDKRGTLRMSAVVSVTPVTASDFVLVDLTDGSEWSFPAKLEPACELMPGATVFERADSRGPQAGSMSAGCKSLQGTFVQGW